MRRRTFVVAVVATTLIAAVIRFATLDRQSFWFDELVTVSLLHRGFADLLREIPTSEATPYLYYVLAWPWTRLFGFGEVGLRSLSALVGAAIVPPTYGAAATLVSRRAGLIAAALVAVNPFLVWYAQEARAYSLFAFFAALTVYFFARVLRGGGRSSLVGWAVAASLAFATHYFAVFLVVPEAVWLLVRSRRRRPVLLASLLPAAVIVAHFPLILDQRRTGEAVSESGLAGRMLGIPKDLLVGYSFPGELAGTAAAAVLALVGAMLVVAAQVRCRRAAAVAGALALIYAAVPLALGVIGPDYVIARNMIAAVVPAAVFLAAGYAARRVGTAAAALLCALSLAITLAVAFDARYGRTDWRGAAKAVGAPGIARAIVVTPNIERRFWKPYLSGLRDLSGPKAAVREIVVLGLATEGGFSTGAVHPPPAVPRTPPPGFRLFATRRTATFALVRYRSQGGIAPVAPAVLPELRLSSVQPGIFLQAGLRRHRR